MRFQRKHPQETRERGRRMRREGASFPEIGRALAVPPRTVRGWAEVDGCEGPEEVAAAEPAAGKPAGRVRGARLKDRERAFNETWSLVLQQLAVVLALPAATPAEMTRFEREMRRLMLLVGLLTKLAPLLKRATPLRR